MRRSLPHPFIAPARRVPAHGVALGAAALATALAVAALVLPMSDEALAGALPLALVTLFAALAGSLARLDREG